MRTKDTIEFVPQPLVTAPTKKPEWWADQGTADEEIRLQDYWWVIRKRIRLVLAVFLGAMLVTAVLMSLIPPTYTAWTTILIEQQIPKIVDIQKDVISDTQGPDEYDYYRTQYSILQSRSLAAQVLGELDLKHNSLYTGEAEIGVTSRLWNEGRRWLQMLRSFIFPARAHTSEADTQLLIDTYLTRTLQVEPIKNTRLVNIGMSTPDPELSAAIANAHAEAYVRQGLELRTRPNEEAENFLQKKLGELKARVEASETALNHYRREKGLISLDDKENIVVERLADLNKRLTEAEAQRIALEAQVQLIRKRNYEALPVVINSELIRTLKTQQARLEGELAQISSEFKDKYPPVARLQARVKVIKGRLQQEIQQVVAGIESAYLVAQANEKTLRIKMEEQKAATLGLKDAAVEYAVLSRELDTNRQLYQSVLQRMKEMGVAAALPTSNVVVIDKAEPPLFPSSPRKLRGLALSMLGGLLGSIGLAFFLEYLDNTFKTPEEVERYLHLPNLAMVPDFFSLPERKQMYGTPPRISFPLPEDMEAAKELIPARLPPSLATEAYRKLRTAILLSRAEEPPRTVLFTSGKAGEGKTITVLNTAIVFAQMGARVLVIDADLRCSGCHNLLGTENRLGLAEVLAGQRQVNEVIQPIVQNFMSFLSSGSLPPNPAELLGSDKMREILIALRKEYDYVLVDSPPLSAVTDSVLLSILVDGVVLVVDSQETPHPVVKKAYADLRYARAKMLGVVLNRVSPQSRDYRY